MLSEKTTERLAERLANRIENVNMYIIKLLGERIKQFKTLTPSGARQLAQILKFGGDINKITEELAKATGLNIEEINEIYQQVAKENLYFSKQFYEYKGVDFIPYKENIALQQQVEAMARITRDTFLNLSRTTAFGDKPIAEMYKSVIDEAVISVTQGKENFDQSMYKTLKELDGLKTVDYQSGRKVRLDSAVSMAIKEGITNVFNKTQDIFGEEYGADGVEISVHDNPAPDHAPIQGLQFSKYGDRKVKGKIYKDFKAINKELKRPIGKMNCYHYIWNIVLGASEPNYTKQELNKINKENEKGFTYEGKKYTNYEGTQLQRRMELEIRKTKEQLELAKASDNSVLKQKSEEKLQALTHRYFEFSKISRLPTKIERLRVVK